MKQIHHDIQLKTRVKLIRTFARTFCKNIHYVGTSSTISRTLLMDYHYCKREYVVTIVSTILHMPVIQMATTFTTVIPLTTDLLSRTWFYRIEWSIHFMLLIFVVQRYIQAFYCIFKTWCKLLLQIRYRCFGILIAARTYTIKANNA